MLEYRRIKKCEDVAKGYRGEADLRTVEKVLGGGPGVVSVEFLPAEGAPEYPVYQTGEDGILDARIPVKEEKETFSVFHIRFKTARPDYEKEWLEHMCMCFNRKPVKVAVRKGSRWGDVEVRQIENTHANYYSPDKAVLYTNKVLQYVRPEEIDAFIEKELTPSRIRFNEDYRLDYDLFKMRIRLCDDDKLSHEMDADGVWWVNCPRWYDFTRRNTQEYMREYFKKVITSAAEEYFPRRVAYIESRMMTGKKIRNIECRMITTGNASAWNHLNRAEPGSTMDDGTRDLRFDPALMAYPKKYTDQVIIHELCHNLIFDHSKAFKDLEDKWCFALTGVGPHYYDEFFRSHRFIFFAEEQFQPYKK